MFRNSLIFAGALAGALVWSIAAEAAPGQTTGAVNMRSGPGTSYPVVAQIPARASVDISNCNNWCEVRYAGRDGYVSASLVAALNSSGARYAYDPGYAYYDTAPGFYDNYYNDNGPYGFGYGLNGHHFHGGFGGGHGHGGGYGHGGGDGGHGWGGGHGYGGGIGVGSGHGFGGGLGDGGGHGFGGGGHGGFDFGGGGHGGGGGHDHR